MEKNRKSKTENFLVRNQLDIATLDADYKNGALGTRMAIFLSFTVDLKIFGMGRMR